MSIIVREPLGLKEEKRKDAYYLQLVRELPCCICEAFGEMQRLATQAHHPIHDRHSKERAPDHEAIPLCEGHHMGDFDTTKFAIHRGKRSWRAKYGSDREYIAVTLDKIQKIHGYDPTSKARP